ncbi:MAG: ribosome silencing factor [bacterium]|jgi:ribosome-associated protein
MDGRAIAFVAAQAADEKKAKDVIILDIQSLSPLCDYFVIASGGSRVQVKAIAEAIEEKLALRGIKVEHREGNDKSGWILLDYGDIVVHIFHDQQRAFYDLERLWGDAKRIELNA